jgi:hypothetical protein
VRACVVEGGGGGGGGGTWMKGVERGRVDPADRPEHQDIGKIL